MQDGDNGGTGIKKKCISPRLSWKIVAGKGTRNKGKKKAQGHRTEKAPPGKQKGGLIGPKRTGRLKGENEENEIPPLFKRIKEVTSKP